MEEANMIVQELLCKLQREEVEDSHIMSQQINMSFRRYLLMKKYQLTEEQFIAETVRKEQKLYFRDNAVFNFKTKDICNIDILEIIEGKLIIQGRTNLSYYLQKYDIYAFNRENGQRWQPKIIKNNVFDQFVNDVRVFESVQFYFELPLQKGGRYQFVLVEKESGSDIFLEPVFQYFAKFNETMKFTYFANYHWLLKVIKNEIRIYENSWFTELRAERKYLQELKKKLKGDRKTFCRICGYRLAAKLHKYLTHKELWLISDRPNLAGDNGEVFFEYVVSKREKKAFFLLDKNCADYKRVKKVGKVIPYGGFSHKLCFLCCDQLVSASADGWVFNAMREDTDYVKDLYQFNYVFLQHGVIEKDFAAWLNKRKKNIKLFVTSAYGEYYSIAHERYGYSGKEVKLTGLPRYDKLENHPEKVISIMPTWRKGIAAEHVPLVTNSKIMVRGYSKDFVNSDYYKYYQGLLSNERLIRALEQHGYICTFYLHSSFANQAVDFRSESEHVIIHSGQINYRETIGKSALVVTDYSSVAIDYAYLKKPVVYFQFDLETFLYGHTGTEGYFDFEEDGFGPVCQTIDETVGKIIRYMENQCSMEERYQQRVDAFFGYNDRENRKRVYEAVCALPKQRRG